MVRILTIPSLIVVMILTSCALPREGPPALEVKTPIPTGQVAELNKPMRTLKSCNADVWSSFQKEEEKFLSIQQHRAETDKLFADLEAIAKAKDLSKLDQAQADLDKLKADRAKLEQDKTALAQANPIFILTLNANCHEGPDTRSRVIRIELAGKYFPIVGRSEDVNWYLVQPSENARCWFANTVGTVSGDLSQLQICSGPPFPTDTPRAVVQPIACSTHKDKDGCNADSACTWVFTPGSPGYCKTK